MIPMWLASLIVIGVAIGIILLVMAICYGFVLFLKIKDKVGRK